MKKEDTWADAFLASGITCIIVWFLFFTFYVFFKLFL